MERKEAHAPESVVEADQNDALPGKLDAQGSGLGAAAEYKGAAVNPNHNGQLGVWGVRIDEQRASTTEIIIWSRSLARFESNYATSDSK